MAVGESIPRYTGLYLTHPPEVERGWDPQSMMVVLYGRPRMINSASAPKKKKYIYIYAATLSLLKNVWHTTSENNDLVEDIMSEVTTTDQLASQVF